MGILTSRFLALCLLAFGGVVWGILALGVLVLGFLALGFLALGILAISRLALVIFGWGVSDFGYFGVLCILSSVVLRSCLFLLWLVWFCVFLGFV